MKPSHSRSRLSTQPIACRYTRVYSRMSAGSASQAQWCMSKNPKKRDSTRKYVSRVLGEPTFARSRYHSLSAPTGRQSRSRTKRRYGLPGGPEMTCIPYADTNRPLSRRLCMTSSLLPSQPSDSGGRDIAVPSLLMFCISAELYPSAQSFCADRRSTRASSGWAGLCGNSAGTCSPGTVALAFHSCRPPLRHLGHGG